MIKTTLEIRKFNNEFGFTLLEVMVTLMLAVLAATSLLWGSLSMRHSAKSATTQMQAAAIAQSYLEESRATDYDALADDFIANVTLSDNATNDDDDDILGDVTVDVTSNGDNTKTIQVTVAWNERRLGGDRAQTLTMSRIAADL